jgi:hypothetical protein
MGVIVVQSKGKAVPKAFIEVVVKNNNACTGLALVEEGKGRVDFAREPAIGTADSIMELLETVRDSDSMHYYGSGEYHTDDIPPQVLLTDSKGNAILVCMAEGDFSNWGEAESAHSDAWLMIQKFLRPKIEMLWELVEQDLTKLFKALRNPTIVTEINNAILTRGIISLMSASGEFFSYCRGDEHKYPWGWASQSYGYKEGTTADESKKLSIKEQIEAKRKGKETTKTMVQDSPSTDAAAITKEEVETGVETVELVYPPAGITKISKLEKWYRTKNKGILPDGWQQRVGVPVQRTIKDFATAKAVLSDEERVANRANKDTTTHHITAATPTEVEQVVREELPIIDKKVIDDVSAFMGQDGVIETFDFIETPIIDPRFMQLTEIKTPTMAETIGVPGGLRGVLWSKEKMTELASKHPEIVAGMAIDFRAAYYAALRTLSRASIPKETEKKELTLQEKLAERKRLKTM